MLLSQVTPEQMKALTDDQVTEIVYGSCADDGQTGLAALLLGSSPLVMRERAEAAARLYLDGRVSYIIPSGGVQWDTDRGRMSECDRMSLMLEEMGVPREAIIPENEATTTRENMLFGAAQMERHLHPRGQFRVFIVSSACHLRRSLALARLYLPRTALLSCCPDQSPDGQRDQWQKTEERRKDVYWELDLLKKCVDLGDIADIEF